MRLGILTEKVLGGYSASIHNSIRHSIVFGLVPVLVGIVVAYQGEMEESRKEDIE